MKKAVLLSGGVDSICLVYGIKPDLAYTIDYGQNVAEREIYVSNYICNILNIEHRIIKVDCKHLGSGSLANAESDDISPSKEWWPFRNQLLITIASMQAVKDSVKEIYLASVKSDNFHKDGTKNFYDLINNLLLYQEGEIKVICPTIEYFSHELVEKYNVPIKLITMAHSCHISNLACGKCSGCVKQLRVRYELDIA
jgi:7-cyano-7-deazaguanine synthase